MTGPDGPLRNIDERPWSIEWFCQWPEWFRWRTYNWLNFSLVQVSWEWERHFGAKWELVVMLLGFGFRFHRWDRKSPKWMAMTAEIDQVKAAMRDGATPEEAGLFSTDDVFGKDDDE